MDESFYFLRFVFISNFQVFANLTGKTWCCSNSFNLCSFRYEKVEALSF